MEKTKQSQILIVEDQEEIAELLQLILEDENTAVEVCTDTRQAMQQIAQLKPNLIMMDVNMPYLSGWDILEQMRLLPENAATPVIMMTASADKKALYRERLEQLKAQLVLKPFNNDGVKALVKRMLLDHKPVQYI